jgi:sugar porter (SP) family MFS transporter|nr:sugar porter family MFS transporter [uncultured Rhodopila sp.]
MDTLTPGGTAGVPSVTSVGTSQLPAAPLPLTGQSMTPWLVVAMAVILFAGALFGYDQGVISGALDGIKKSFVLTPLLAEVVTSWVTLGAMFGALAGGELADRFGRRNAILFSGVLFTLGAAVQAFAPVTAVLVCGRLIVGAAVGVIAVAAPLYGAELAPRTLRGRIVSGYQFAITIGIFLAYLVNDWLSSTGSWRVMLGSSAVPGVLLLLVAVAAPESPRWLMKMGRRPQAKVQMQKIRPKVDAEDTLNMIDKALREETESAAWSEVFHREWRRPLMIGIGLAVFQQITGINAIIYYANQIFASAGFALSSQATLTTWAIGGVNVAATVIALVFVDRWGRRKLLLGGLLGMGISLAVLGVVFRFIVPAASGAAATAPSVAGIITLCGLIAFIISFAASIGPVTWTVITEIFPGRIRGRAVSVCTAFNWLSAFAVSQCFLSMVDAAGSSLTFGLFALFCVIGWIWIFLQVPETKGRSLEEIQQTWNTKS